MTKRTQQVPPRVSLIVSEGQRITGPGTTASTFVIDLGSPSFSVRSPRAESDGEFERVSDDQFERERQVLLTQRQQEIDAWQEDYADVDGPVAELIEINARFWYLEEKAHFECCLRNWDQLPSRDGRKPKRFRWFRTVRADQQPHRPGPLRDGDDERVLERAMDLLSTGRCPSGRGQQRLAVAIALLEEAFRAVASDPERPADLRQLQRLLGGTPVEARRAVSALATEQLARFVRLVKGVSRALRRSQRE